MIQHTKNTCHKIQVKIYGSNALQHHCAYLMKYNEKQIFAFM